MAEIVFSLESILTLQGKINSSMQAARITIFSRMLDIFSFASNEENSAHGGNSRGSDTSARSTVGAAQYMFRETREVLTDFAIQSLRLRVFKFADLKRATRNFSANMLLGEGGFGKVFLGWVDQKTFAPSKRDVGVAVAVKRLNPNSLQGQAEVNFLGRLAHPNIICLLAFCIDKTAECLLVYEYMQNGSFDGILFKSAPDITEALPWQTRLNIMIGVARGLAYLHSTNVICRGVKGSDMLLDQDFNAKLGDFGLAKSGPANGMTHVTTRVMGTYGYVAPEYVMTGHLTIKSDIYSFGVVLLETLTGKRAINRNRPNGHNLVEWAKPIITNRSKLKNIMDPRLEENYPPKAAFKCAALALRCLADTSKDRPSSEEVLQSLEEIYAVNE